MMMRCRRITDESSRPKTCEITLTLNSRRIGASFVPSRTVELPHEGQVLPFSLRDIDGRHGGTTDALPQHVPVAQPVVANPPSVTKATRQWGATCRIHSNREGSVS